MSDFTPAKRKTRELNLLALRACLGVQESRGDLAYFGLPSPGLEDVTAWQGYLARVDAVERGAQGREWRAQHDLSVNAILWGVPGFRLYRGDIDDIILLGKDAGGQAPRWPFDIINLDYTGGLLYKDAGQRARRVEAIKLAIEKQGRNGHSFFLVVTVNDQHHDAGEIAKVLDEMVHDAARDQVDLTGEVQRVKESTDKRRSAFLYLAYTVMVVGRQWFRVSPYRPILYTGRGGYAMLNASFCLRSAAGRSAPARSGLGYRELVALSPIDLDAGSLVTCQPV